MTHSAMLNLSNAKLLNTIISLSSFYSQLLSPLLLSKTILYPAGAVDGMNPAGAVDGMYPAGAVDGIIPPNGLVTLLPS